MTPDSTLGSKRDGLFEELVIRFGGFYPCAPPQLVMAGLVPAIHGFFVQQGQRTWMPGSSPGMTMCKKTAVGGIAHRPDCM